MGRFLRDDTKLKQTNRRLDFKPLIMNIVL
jgi:hypothetical protein